MVSYLVDFPILGKYHLPYHQYPFPFFHKDYFINEQLALKQILKERPDLLKDPNETEYKLLIKISLSNYYVDNLYGKMGTDIDDMVNDIYLGWGNQQGNLPSITPEPKRFLLEARVLMYLRLTLGDNEARYKILKPNAPRVIIPLDLADIEATLRKKTPQFNAAIRELTGLSSMFGVDYKNENFVTVATIVTNRLSKLVEGKVYALKDRSRSLPPQALQFLKNAFYLKNLDPNSISNSTFSDDEFYAEYL